MGASGERSVCRSYPLVGTEEAGEEHEGVAIWEAYVREAALSLELITKAVISQRIESYGESSGHKSVPISHKVPSLWEIAALPRLPIADRYMLLTAERIPQWSGRYAAPRRDDQFFEEQKEWQALKALEDDEPEAKTPFRRDPGFAWSDVSRIFKIAEKDLWRLRDRWPPRRVLRGGRKTGKPPS